MNKNAVWYGAFRRYPRQWTQGGSRGNIRTYQKHITTLKEMFGRLRKARITARPTTCLLGADRMEFLGHQIGGDVITLSRGSLEKVSDHQQASEILSRASKDHIPAFAEISAPLTDLLKKEKSEHIQWSEGQGRAYSLLKEYLLQEPVLKLPDLSKPFDAYRIGVTAILMQENEGNFTQWATPARS